MDIYVISSAENKDLINSAIVKGLFSKLNLHFDSFIEHVTKFKRIEINVDN